MCITCFENAGKPSIINDRTKHTADLIGKLYDYTNLGGAAQSVVDDWNVDNETINGCLIHLEINKESDTSNIEKEVLELIRSLEKEERYSALAIYHNFI